MCFVLCPLVAANFNVHMNQRYGSLSEGSSSGLRLRIANKLTWNAGKNCNRSSKAVCRHLNLFPLYFQAEVQQVDIFVHLLAYKLGNLHRRPLCESDMSQLCGKKGIFQL